MFTQTQIQQKIFIVSMSIFKNSQVVQLIPQNSKQRVSGVCKKADFHDNKKIEYICLEENCSQNRQLCKVCVAEQHRLHKLYRIDKLLPPLNKLNMNSYLANSQEKYAYFQEKISEILQEWQNLQTILKKHMSQMNYGIIAQLRAVMETFKEQEINRAENLLLDTNTKIEDINQIVKSMQFLEQKGITEVQILCDSAKNITINITKGIKKLGQKMNMMMEKFQKQVKKMSFINMEALNFKKTSQQSEEDENIDQDKQQNNEQEFVSYPMKRIKKMTVVQIDN